MTGRGRVWVVMLAAALMVQVASAVLNTQHKLDLGSSVGGWREGGRADAKHAFTVVFAVRQRNLDELERSFWSVSDPQNSDYGKFLSHQEVKDLVAPLPLSLTAIKEWLASSGVAEKNIDLANSGDFIRVTADVDMIEKMFDIVMVKYVHAETGTIAIRSHNGGYTLPSHLYDHVDFVGGLTRLPTLARKAPKKVSSPQASINPAVAKKFFNMPSDLKGTNATNSQAVAQFLEQYFSPDDLSLFQRRMSVAQTPVEKVVGPNDPKNPGVEASLDIEYIMGIAENVPTWFVYTAGRYQTQEPFLNWIVNLSSDASSPLVHSVSYGDDESSIEPAYLGRVDIEFMKYGLQGRSILFASGDDGTGCDNKCKKFLPNWPASSAYVTAVGGVYLEGSTAVGDSISSGGFSNAFNQPSYQKSAVSLYLSSHSSPAPSLYNASGRAIPDIASFSENVDIIVGGSGTPVAGTSCAAPVISGVTALLNDARLNAGKPPMGFLNPFLYQTLAAHPDAFYDVTKGNNGGACCGRGFDAATGWDPITGVGLPNWPKLVSYALAATK